MWLELWVPGWMFVCVCVRQVKGLVVMLSDTAGEWGAPEHTNNDYLRTESKTERKNKAARWCTEGEMLLSLLHFGWGGSRTGSGFVLVAADWRSNSFSNLFISTTSEVRTVRGPEIPSPRLSLPHTHTRTPLNYAKRPFNKYDPHATKSLVILTFSLHFVFPLLSTLDSRPPR